MRRQICIFWTAILVASVLATPAWGQWQSNSKGIHYNGGNVAIGLANPERDVTVSSGSSVQTMFAVDNSGQGHATIGLDANGGQVTGVDYLILRQKSDLTSVIGNWANEPLLLKTDGTERVRIGANGNVGIGTTTLKEKLAVGGRVLAEEVIVKPQSEWSDFVLQETYDLPTLKEVASFIEQEGRLQDVPSAEAVKEDGIRLGEMDATLLQKVEELMLYAIEQKQRADSQAQSIEELRRENDRLRRRLDAQQRQIKKLARRVRGQK